MAENIIGNMFGVDPDQLRQQQLANMQAQAYQYAQLDPMAQAKASMFMGGSMLADTGARMLGMQTPEEKKAQIRQAALSGLDTSNSADLAIAIKRLTDAGDTQGATALAQTLRQVKLEESRIAKDTALSEDIPKQRHEETMARIQQAADAAKQRSEDTRLAIQQRDEAAKRHEELMKYLAEIKQSDKTSTSEIGQNTVSNLTTQLRDYYNQLDKQGAITNPNKSVLDNIGAWVSSSGAGQFAGGMVGSDAQTIRNAIAQQRPLLLQAIKQATGMTAKQMDSNKDVEIWLGAATDPKLSVKANREALDMLDKLYGIDGVGIPKQGKVTTETKTSIPAGVAEEWIRVNGKLQRK